MSWTQVYVTGLSQTVEPSDEEIEKLLDNRYNLSNDTAVMWAGCPLIKRDDSTGVCRGFAFLSFYSADGAAIVIDRINNDPGVEEADGLPRQLRAELSNPKKVAKKKSKANNNDDDLPDLRFRRQRAQPIRKHPVITSSSGKRTNLGNKTK